MKLNIRAFTIAQTVAAAILYVVCAFFVGFLPDTSARLATYAFHADFSGLMRPPTSVGSFAAGLLVVSVGWGLLSLIMAGIYDSLTKNVAPNHISKPR